MVPVIHIVEDDLLTLCELDACEEQSSQQYRCSEFVVTDCEVELNRRMI